MFGGLVWASVEVTKLSTRPQGGVDLEITFSDPRVKEWKLGDSIAIDGVCLTIVKISDIESLHPKFLFEVSPETLACTTLGFLNVGSKVHVEPAMSLADRIGGHIVSGHVDGVAPLSLKVQVGDFWRLEWKLTDQTRDRVAPYLVEKGSVAVDGVSLTVNAVRDTETETFFDVMLIPHTLEVTTLGSLMLGDFVNLEADVVAKYVSRSLHYAKLNSTPEGSRS